MKIYGVEIKMPHSGRLTRSTVINVLYHAVKNNYCGVGDFEKSMLKEECKKHYTTLLIEDINYNFVGTLK